MHQLALRTGAYKTINVIDVREGELESYNRLTEEVKINFIEDEEERLLRVGAGELDAVRTTARGHGRPGREPARSPSPSPASTGERHA